MQFGISRRARGDSHRGAAALLPLALAALALLASSAAAEDEAAAESKAEASTAQLSLQVQGGRGAIFIDGDPVGSGSFAGPVPAGRHELRVSLAGYEDWQRPVDFAPGQVHAQSVQLRRRVGEAHFDSTSPQVAARDGVYGGVSLLAAFQPQGSGTTLADACDSIGATNCSAGSVFGGGLSTHVGLLYFPLGLELAVLLSGDVVSPSAHFDGETGSEINPVVAAPARTESFSIGRFGGGAALRARLVQSVSRFHFSFAIGPGISYRVFAMERDTRAEDGRRGRFADAGATYFSPMLSMELAASARLGKSTSLTLGALSWIEHAGDGAESEPAQQTVISGPAGEGVVAQATPPYDLANGAQWFIGPFVGLTFGL